ARVRRQIRDAGLAVHVALVGHVPNAALPRHLAAHDVMVVPSSYEALGIAYLEAMRFGLPVVATTAGGAGEIVTHGCEGFLVAPGDVGGLTSYLRRWVDEVAGPTEGAHVLDAGCGFGGTVFHWRARVGGRYEGLTLSRVQLDVARREARRRGVDDVCSFHLRSYDEHLAPEFDVVVAIESLI